nr:LVIVD repeat protein [Candidatus Prometheoarchaeum syntrophicum]
MIKKARLLFIIMFTLMINGFMTGSATQSELKLKKIGVIDTNGQVMDIVVENNIAYIVDDLNGFFIYNVSDSSNPIELYHDSSAGRANGIDIVGDLAYLAVVFEGLKVYNISNLADPINIGNFEDSGAIVDVQIMENVAYLSDHGSIETGTGGIKIINVSDSSNPYRITTFNGGGKPSNLFAKNKTIYAADYEFGYEILNVSDPIGVNCISKLNQDTGFFGVYVENDFAYFTDNSFQKGLYIYDMKNLSNPILVNSFSMEGDPCDLQVNNNIAYIADSETGLHIINVSNPNSLVQIGHYSDGGKPFDVEICDHIVYVADIEDGVEIIEWSFSNNQTISGYGLGIFVAIFITISLLQYRLKK